MQQGALVDRLATTWPGYLSGLTAALAAGRMHRVVNPPVGLVNARRQSIGFFCHPNYDAIVECVPTCREAGAPRYAPIRVGDYMRAKIEAVRGVNAEEAA